jgi:hypothetical protein
MERSTTVGVARGLVNIYTPVARHLNRHVSRRAKSVQPKFSSGLNSRKTQRSKADDSSAQKWRSLFVHKFPGHQIVGLVEKTGSRATRFPIGSRVGIAWLHRTERAHTAGWEPKICVTIRNLRATPWTAVTRNMSLRQNNLFTRSPGITGDFFGGVHLRRHADRSCRLRNIAHAPELRPSPVHRPEPQCTGEVTFQPERVGPEYMLSSKSSQLAAEGPSGFEPGSNGNHTSSELHL